MTRDKILFYTIGLRKGGAEHQLVKLATHLGKTSDVVIIHFIPGNDFSEALETNNLTVLFFPLRIKSIFSICKFIRVWRPSLVISFMFGANIIGRITKIIFKLPLITSVRNNEISSLYKTLYRITYKLDNISTFNSASALKKFVELRLTDHKKSIVVNNAVFVAKREYKKKNNEVFTLVSIAHFRPQKDYRTLFEAISLLKKEGIKVKLYVLGHLFQNTWPSAVIDVLGIQNQVEIVGFTQETIRYMAKADFLVLSSLWEGTPNAILEGMAHNLPIIASNIPGVAELVSEAQCGLLFQARNPLDLKDKIKEMINSSEEQKAYFARSGFEYVVKNYEEQSVLSRWENIIHTVLNEK